VCVLEKAKIIQPRSAEVMIVDDFLLAQGTIVNKFVNHGERQAF
jgi:hypothetical protein